ncbi:hypothetical protein GN956_G14014 [Arapaima gigas]
MVVALGSRPRSATDTQIADPVGTSIQPLGYVMDPKHLAKIHRNPVGDGRLLYQTKAESQRERERNRFFSTHKAADQESGTRSGLSGSNQCPLCIE